MQVLRPRLGYGSDVGGRRTPWIVGGMAVLALGGVGRGARDRLDGDRIRSAGIALAVLAFVLIGVGVGAAGTSLLVLLAKRVDDDAARRRGHHRLDDDDRRLRRHRRRSPGSCSIRSRRRAWWR